MSARLVSVGVAAALLVGITGAIIAACYDVPRPDCGFVCGPAGACPSDYTCADDHYCHRTGAPAGLVCATIDAAPPGRDGTGDAMPDAMLDAMPDAMADAMIDAMPDVMIDAMADAMADAELDAADAME